MDLNTVYNETSLTHWAGTLSKAFEIDPPNQADTPLDWLVRALSRDIRDGEGTLGKGRFDRVLVYNPDAQAQWLLQRYTHMYTPVLERLPHFVPFRTVFPSFTPVCFGSMYTGVLPAVHGIQSYSKPIIKTDCLFDALLRAGKKTCLAAVEGCSMSKIFIDRPIDYVFKPKDAGVVDAALDLIKEDRYDWLSVYNQEYDDLMHANGPEHETAMEAIRHHVDSFVRLYDAVEENWKDHNTLIVWAPDHGVHMMEEGHGWHGTDLACDLNIFHYFGAVPARK